MAELAEELNSEGECAYDRRFNYMLALLYNYLKILPKLLRFNLSRAALWINVPWGMKITTDLAIVLTKPFDCEASMLTYWPAMARLILCV
jgi:hypothetical protein